jgi:hypothetical protein
LVVSWLWSRIAGAAVAGVVMALGAGLPAGATSGAAARSAAGSGADASPNFLYGAAATSPADAWAVGYYSDGTAYQSLIEHWDGASWTTVPSPDPKGGSVLTTLTGVAATSARNAWAVGGYNPGSGPKTLIIHWNGSKWASVPSPNSGNSANYGSFSAVTAISGSDAWAVGEDGNGLVHHTLIAHWDGRRWRRVASPNVGTRSNFLFGVAAVSRSGVWAVGYYFTGSQEQTLIERWNGKSWAVVKSADVGGSAVTNDLSGVTAVSARDAWAVGHTSPGKTLIEHWNGARWTVVPSPTPGSGANLNAVAAVSANSIWAVGQWGQDHVGQTLIEHWDGRHWKQASSPDVAGTNNDSWWAVTTTRGTAWAAGTYVNMTTGQYQALGAREIGHTWTLVPTPSR